MRRLARPLADDAPKRGPRYELFLALVSLCKFIQRPYIVVSQAKLVQRLRERNGLVMSRRTLNRHLNGLERLAVINRTKRHQRDRAGTLRFRSTLYTFGQRGILWIKQLRSDGEFPLGRLRVPKMAQSQRPYLHQQCPHCGEDIHNAGNGNGKSRPPRKRGGATRPPAEITSGARPVHRRAMRATGTALSREEARISYHLAKGKR